jgi:hypothetical protein
VYTSKFTVGEVNVAYNTILKLCVVSSNVYWGTYSEIVYNGIIPEAGLALTSTPVPPVAISVSELPTASITSNLTLVGSFPPRLSA